MLSSSRKKALNEITRFEINPNYNPYTLVVMKDLMKTPFPLAEESCFHSQEYLQRSKKIVLTSRNNVLL